MVKLTRSKGAKGLKVSLCLIVLLVLIAVCLHLTRRAFAEEYRTFSSPDANYKVVVYSLPVLFSMPGGSGDSPGYVQLHDKAGRVLEEKDVDMVQNADQVYWEGNKVEVKLIAEWELPPQK